jgi:hypothetical protein
MIERAPVSKMRATAQLRRRGALASFFGPESSLDILGWQQGGEIDRTTMGPAWVYRRDPRYDGEVGSPMLVRGVVLAIRCTTVPCPQGAFFWRSSKPGGPTRVRYHS